MEKEKKFFYEVNEFKEYITKLIALEYGENLSYDELLKLKSMNNLESLKPRQKTHYINNCNYFINNLESSLFSIGVCAINSSGNSKSKSSTFI